MTKVHGVHAENNNKTNAVVLWAFAATRCNPRLALAYIPLFREKFAGDISNSDRGHMLIESSWKYDHYSMEGNASEDFA